jgi:hypothetical protein
MALFRQLLAIKLLYLYMGMRGGNFIIFVFLVAGAYAIRLSHGCGGGWAPYIPPTASGGASANTEGRLQIFEKGVSYSLFDPKALQPLVRNIVLSGNLRKKGKLSPSDKAENPDSLASEKDPKADNVDAVLNVHRLH